MDIRSMFNSVDLHMVCIAFNLAIIIIYFSKKRVVTERSKLFVVLMFSTLIGTLVDIIAIASIATSFSRPITANVVCKMYLVTLLMNVSLMVIYLFNLMHENEVKAKNTMLIMQEDIVDKAKKIIGVEKTSKYSKMISSIFWFVFIIDTVVLIGLPIEYNDVPGYLYDYGKCIDYTFISVGIKVAVLFVFFVLKWKYLEKNTKINIVACTIVSILITIVQTQIPSLLTTSFLVTMLMIIMYFSVQNPDIEIIKQLNEAKKSAEDANEQKTTFLLGMSHEIRTPLNSVVGYTEILKEKNLSDEFKEGIDSILIASNSLLDIVSSILDISKIETNKLDIESSTYSFRRMYKELVTLAGSRIGNKNLEFRYWMDPNIPDKLIGDYIHTKQVVLNILTNAIKYTKEGYVDFKVNAAITEDYCTLKITVEDTGIGIKKENIGRLFGKFDRLGVESEMDIEGTGLGLAITKRLLKLMGGKISVQSVYGRGSIFTIELKQLIDKHALQIDKKYEEIVDKKQTFENKTILIVDDNMTSVKILAKLLEKYKVKTLSLETGDDCLKEAVFGSKVDLIIMDDTMPGLSGVETLARLKKIAGFDVPTIMLTANAITGMREKYIAAGFDEYMAKPINVEELDVILNKFLR